MPSGPTQENEKQIDRLGLNRDMEKQERTMMQFSINEVLRNPTDNILIMVY